MLPIKKKNGVEFSVEDLLTWTNLRAMMENSGLGGKYSDLFNLTLHELMKHIGLYLLQALSPSPQVDIKKTPRPKIPWTAMILSITLLEENQH